MPLIFSKMTNIEQKEILTNINKFWKKKQENDITCSLSLYIKTIVYHKFPYFEGKYSSEHIYVILKTDSFTVKYDCS